MRRVSVVRAKTAASRSKEPCYERAPTSGPASFLSPPQDLPVLGGECAEDRLQGRQAASTLYFGARQDRAVAHHRGVREKAARAFQSHQAGALHGASALRRKIGAVHASCALGTRREARPDRRRGEGERWFRPQFLAAEEEGVARHESKPGLFRDPARAT